MRRLVLPLLALASAAPGGGPRPGQAGIPDPSHTFVDTGLEELGDGLAALRDYVQAPSDLVWIQVGLRDAARAATEFLALAEGMLPPPPDLTALVASPVPDVESSGFGWRDDPTNRRRRKFHKGTDFSADHGTPVHAAGDGVVVFTGWQNGYGRVIYVDHGGGLVTRYAHLQRIEVDTGDRVAAAARIGKVGASGRTTGPHLHFEVRLEGRAVDPVLAMQVAQAQRETPGLAPVMAAALAPDVQEQALDRLDETNQRRARAPSGRRSQALW
jgi:murein DD-endopeptidase MepM/ murein hydrolase activator NlpD